MGNQVLRAGDSFFIPAEAPYVYTAGPDGVEILEIRHRRPAVRHEDPRRARGPLAGDGPDQRRQPGALGSRSRPAPPSPPTRADRPLDPSGSGQTAQPGRAEIAPNLDRPFTSC